MNASVKRSVVRWIHLALGVPIVGYVYSPFKELPSFAPAVRLGFLPALILTGFWLWKGPAVRRLLSRRSA